MAVGARGKNYTKRGHKESEIDILMKNVDPSRDSINVKLATLGAPKKVIVAESTEIGGSSRGAAWETPARMAKAVQMLKIFILRTEKLELWWLWCERFNLEDRHRCWNLLDNLKWVQERCMMEALYISFFNDWAKNREANTTPAFASESLNDQGSMLFSSLPIR